MTRYCIWLKDGEKWKLRLGKYDTVPAAKDAVKTLEIGLHLILPVGRDPNTPVRRRPA